MTRLRAHVDPTKCEGFGPCHDALPEVFSLDEWGYAYTENDGLVPEGKEEEARRAVDSCPVQAVTVSEEPDA